MNSKLKLFVGGAAAGLMAFLPLSAFASTVTSNAIFNGQTNTYGNAGGSVNANFQVNIPAGEVLHAIRTKVDGQATVCTPVGPYEGAQVVDVPVTITLPPNSSGSGYGLVADLFTTDTVPEALVMTGDLACTSGTPGSHVNLGAYSGGNVVNVLPTSGVTSGTSVTSSNDLVNALLALMLKLGVATNTPATTPAPVVSTKCSGLATAMTGAVQGQSQKYDGSPNIRLQGFLLANGESIPALTAGAAFGFYGTQTANAVSMFKLQNSCQ